jgi:hypothetical protein
MNALHRLPLLFVAACALVLAALGIGRTLPGEQIAFSYAAARDAGYRIDLADISRGMRVPLRLQEPSVRLRGWADRGHLIVGLVSGKVALYTLAGQARPLHLPSQCAPPLVTVSTHWLTCVERTAQAQVRLMTLDCALAGCTQMSAPITLAGFALQFAFSPDERLLVALHIDGSVRALSLYETANGALLWQSPPGQAGVTAPTWSPDGTRLAYYDDTADGLDLNVLDVASLRLTRHTLLQERTTIAYALSWSPDSSQVIVHYSSVNSETDAPHWWVADLSSGQQQAWAGSTAQDMRPLWSPSGEQVIVTRRFGGRFGGRLFVLDEAGAAWQVTASQLLDVNAFWRPGG